MGVELVKHIVKVKKKYSVPAKYSSTTNYTLFIDGEQKCKIIIGNNFSNVKQFIKFAKTKYCFDEYVFRNGGTQYQDSQSI
jgi:hypothetical protein